MHIGGFSRPATMCISGYMDTYHGIFLKILADDQWSSITKGSIYHMYDVCTYCVFTSYDSIKKLHTFVYSQVFIRVLTS